MRKVGALAGILVTFLLAASARANIASVFGGAVSCAVQGNGVRFCGATDSSVPTWDGTTPTSATARRPASPTPACRG